MNRTGAVWLASLLALVALLETVGTTVLHAPDETLAGNLSNFAFALFSLASFLVGWLLAIRLPRNGLGWILVGIPVLLQLNVLADPIGAALHPIAPELAKWVWLLFGSSGSDSGGSWAWVPPIWLLLSQMPLRFPTGSLPSRRWRWFEWYSVFAMVELSVMICASQTTVHDGVANPLYIPGIDSIAPIVVAAFGLFGAALVGSIASLFIRYRAADAVVRAQLRWVLWAVALAAFCLGLAWTALALLGSGDLVGILLPIGYAFIPIAIGLAVTRYRLYEIDRIISRTVAYAIVTVVIVAGYAGLIVGLTTLLPRSWGSAGVAIATLAAAAAFLPLLRWVQRWVDRRFNRAAYDAQKVVEQFGERLRNGADPHTAPGDLLDAIGRTLQPHVVGIWVRGDAP